MSTITNPTTPAQAWGETASAYDSIIAQRTAVAARRLIDLTTEVRQITQTSKVLDLGTGTGALALEIARSYPSTSILATDLAEGMLDKLSQLHIPNMQTQVLDAQEIGSLANGPSSHIFSTFMLQFLDDPERVVSGIYKVLEPNGVVGVSVWHENVVLFDIWERACRTIDPSYRINSEFASVKAWTRCEQVKQHMEAAQFVDVEVTDFNVPFDFPSAEAYLDFFYHGNIPSFTHVIKQWKGDPHPVIGAVAEIFRKEYGDGKPIELRAILCVGRKR